MRAARGDSSISWCCANGAGEAAARSEVCRGEVQGVRVVFKTQGLSVGRDGPTHCVHGVGAPLSGGHVLGTREFEVRSGRTDLGQNGGIVSLVANRIQSPQTVHGISRKQLGSVMVRKRNDAIHQNTRGVLPNDPGVTARQSAGGGRYFQGGVAGCQ